MNELNWIWYAVIAACFLAAGLVKGVAGMGLPTVAMGLLGLFMAAPAAAALMVLPSAITNLWQMLAGPHLPALLRRLWPLLLASATGTLLGTPWLVGLDARWSALALGLALVVYAGHSLLAPPLRVPARHEVWLSPCVGLLTGLITGTTGIFVMPAVPYLQALGLPKAALVQALGVSFCVSTLSLAVGLWQQQALQLPQLGASALAVLPALLGMGLGARIRDRISPRVFLGCFRGLMLLLGLELMSRVFR